MLTAEIWKKEMTGMAGYCGDTQKISGSLHINHSYRLVTNIWPMSSVYMQSYSDLELVFGKLGWQLGMNLTIVNARSFKFDSSGGFTKMTHC